MAKISITNCANRYLYCSKVASVLVVEVKQEPSVERNEDLEAGGMISSWQLLGMSNTTDYRDILQH